MRAGPLDRRIAVQRKSVTQSDSGMEIETWTTIGSTDRWASKRPVSGIERYGSDQLEAKEQVEFQLHYSDDLADLHPADRIIEPAADATASPMPERSWYDIFAVHEIGRREGLRVMAARRTVP
jgi:head-tail adaptor